MRWIFGTHRLAPSRFRGAWQTLIEFTIIGICAGWVGRSFLDFNPYTWPVGGEWGGQLQTHQLWTQVQRCGVCALWNGGINGGAPALADLFGSMLHPLVMITTLLWGVVAGAKVAVVVALALGGIAQWWIAWVLRVGPLARMWSALLAVVGGHMAGRVENGNFGLVLSTAACSLALAAAFDLGMTRERRATLLLAVMSAGAIVSGQAYLQLALLCWSPAFLLLMLDRQGRLSSVWREYAVAVGLALLLAGVFLVPLLHFWPNVTKGTDPGFQAAQPLVYIPLNLVTAEPEATLSPTLGKLPYPYMYNLYLGWIPVVLALLALPFVYGSARRPLLFLSTGAFLMFFLASAIPLRWLNPWLPLVANARHTPLFAGLAIPAIIGLATYTLDRLFRLPWSRWTLLVASRSGLRLTWLLAIPLLWSLWTPAALARIWLRTMDARPLYERIAALHTPGLEWVAPPYGELHWTQVGLDLGLKLSPIVWVFNWRELPMPHLEAVRDGAPPAITRVGPWAGLPIVGLNAVSNAYGMEVERAGTLAGIPVYRYSAHQYAAIVTRRHIIPCEAIGSGGALMVTCTSEQAGRLVVQEHAWSGWSAWRDDVPTVLDTDEWLRLEAPAGTHRYLFRYRPWDVPLGLGLTILGSLLTLWLWMRSRVPATIAAGRDR